MDIRPTATLLDLCVLSALSQGSKFLDEIAEELGGVIGVSTSELCARLGRLGEQGMLEAFAWTSDDGERFFYRATNLGLCLLDHELGAWNAFKRRVDAYLYREAAPERAQSVG